MKLLFSNIFFVLFFVLVACESKKDDGHKSAVADGNKIQIENSKQGTKEWMLTNVPFDTCSFPDHRFCRRKSIEGYCSNTSYFAGDTLNIFVSSDPSSEFQIDIFRMGYYGGLGGRYITSSGSIKGAPQPMPAIDNKTNLLECKWDKSFSWVLPDSLTSGVYVGKLTTRINKSQAYVIFIVKDRRKADFVFQCSDVTWQAYNRWPQWHSMYDEGAKPWVNTNGAKISFDRPYSLYVNELPADFNPLSNGSGEFFMWEFPLCYWMEKEGYDVSYISGIDTHSDTSLVMRAKGFLSVSHDEYWTNTMYSNVTKARDKGVNLFFLGGNSLDGKVYLSPGTDGRPNRITGRMPEREFDNEQELMGASSYGVGYSDFVCKSPSHWIFKNTNLKDGDRIKNLGGWEYHGYPLKKDSTLIVLSEDSIRPNKFAAINPPPMQATTIYNGPKGNIVFNAGSCFWPVALSTPPGFIEPVCNQGKEVPSKIDFPSNNPDVQQMTRNLFEYALTNKTK
ncbi:MAG TPA: N,N-dimethylformamidase beta subunit family domain-containing protein [Cytophagaceae bacterium]|jgi:hypothetical protein